MKTNFEHIVNTAPVMLRMTREDGECSYLNPQWYEFSGQPAESGLGCAWLDSIHPEDIESVSAAFSRSKTQHQSFTTEYRMRRNDGNYRWVIDSAVPYFDDDHHFLGYIGSVIDIHEQRVISDNQKLIAEASKILSSFHDLKSALQDIANLAVPHISDWVSIELVDQSIPGIVDQVAIAHVDPEKVTWARRLRSMYPPDLSQPDGLPKVLRSGESEMYPVVTDEMLVAAIKDPEMLELVRKIGFTSVMIVPILINKKAVGAIQFVSTDSKKHFNHNDLEMAEELATRVGLSIQNLRLFEELQQRDLQFQALYDSNIIGVTYVDLDGRIFQANDAFLSMLGYTRDDLENQRLDWNTLTPKEYQNLDIEKIKELRQTGVAKPWEKEYIKQDGSQIPIIIGGVLLDKKTTKTVCFVLDITERKRLDQRKDEFLGIASHELKTPLTSIKGYVQILERIIEEMGNDKAQSLLTKTNTYINRLNSLITDLLDVSRIQSGKLQFNVSEFDVSTLLEESVSALQPTTDHQLIIAETTSVVVEGDFHRLEQVMSNLITNAIKYSPKSDTVVIRAKLDKDHVVVSVEDSGIGIDQKYMMKLFHRFYRVETSSKEFSGLGIGLFISSEIITRHGGRIWVESELGKGSTFYFSLPLK